MAEPAVARAASKPTCVLALQGGGALGAYHIGAYEALAEHGFEPDWLSGISIGAINAAILAGNPRTRRLERLEQLWEMISWPELLPHFGVLSLDIWHNRMSNLRALVAGQPNFFRPRSLSPFLATAVPPTEASFYDTGPMLETLSALVDFDLVNRGPVRLTLGATDVETGEVVYFDSKDSPHPIGPQHVMASGSLPPGFPAVEIDGRYYWDGGCVSNSPAEAVVQNQPPGHTLIFMIDLWSASGKPPTTIDEVLWRAKEIQYASRGHLVADALAMKATLRHAERRAAALADGGPTAEAERQRRNNHRRLDVMHIIYHPGRSHIANSDAEFSRGSIRIRRDAGYRDMAELLAQCPWQADGAAVAAPLGGAPGALRQGLHPCRAGAGSVRRPHALSEAGPPRHTP